MFFGAFWATKQYEFWQGQKTFAVFSYQREWGLWGGIAAQLGVIAILWGLLWWLERSRKGAVISIFRTEAEPSLAQVRAQSEQVDVSTNIIWGKWSLGFGSIMLAVLSLLAAILLARPWVISLAFPFWATKITPLLGLAYDYDFWAYWSSIPQNEAMLSRGIFEDPTSLMNIAFMFGAFIASRTQRQTRAATSWRLSFKETLYRPIVTLIGGALMGYGAIIGLGCNIGGFVAATLSGSIHGWAWVVAALLGTVVGVILRKILRL